ncbi:MAG: hypothetical protein BMS9Abin11_0880 [Gammaproteobacteria bacterium]|nr:MAG: hypothetical protein BMS9Abin11_0880 [Gammaproteobacteria bacterium]
MADKTYNQALAIGTRVGDFEIKSILGIGGFGITYKAWDHVLHCHVAVKEFMPVEFVYRDQNKLDVTAKSEASDKEYQYGLSNFLDEARTLARFNEPNIVRVRRHMEANNTAYLVMDYEDGDSLSNFLIKKKKPLTEEQVRAIIIPILDSLRAVHAKDFLHRDIKPGNIYLRKNGSPVLIDFGSARQALGEHSKTITGIISPGYAPFEQYSPHSKQGPWTDLYAIGATMYRCITNTGKSTVKPSESIARIDAIQSGSPDPMKAAVEVGKGKYSKPFLQVIDWMLAVYAKDRPQSVKEVLDRLVDNKPALSDDVTRKVKRPASSPSNGAKFAIIGIAGLALIIGLAVGGWFLFGGSGDPRITSMLKKANKDFNAGRITSPSGKNALQRYRQILAFEPDNTSAKDGVKKIIAYYITKSGKALEKNLPTRAVSYIRKASGIDPDNIDIVGARKKIGDYYINKARKAVNNKSVNAAKAYVRAASKYLPDGSSSIKDIKKAIARIRSSSSSSSSYSSSPSGSNQYNRAMQAYNSRNFDLALKLLRPLAIRGNARAQNKVGDIYYAGHGRTRKNYAQALRWYRKAAIQGNNNAQFSLGIIYELGRGTTRNSREAEKWFLRSANQGNQYAQTALGIMYQRRKEYKTALRWYVKAAKQKNKTAYYKIGLFYEKGYGLAANRSKAISWYRFSAKRGYQKARDALRRLGAL